MDALILLWMWVAGIVTGALGFGFIPKTWQVKEEYRKLLCGPCKVRIIEWETKK